MNAAIIAFAAYRRLHVTRFLAGRWKGDMHFVDGDTTSYYALQALLGHDGGQMEGRMFYEGFRLIDHMRKESVRGMDVLWNVESAPGRTRKGLLITLKCHREFHHDDAGLDANSNLVYHYECEVVSWLFRQRLLVRAPSGGRMMEGILLKR